MKVHIATENFPRPETELVAIGIPSRVTRERGSVQAELWTAPRVFEEQKQPLDLAAFLALAAHEVQKVVEYTPCRRCASRGRRRC